MKMSLVAALVLTGAPLAAQQPSPTSPATAPATQTAPAAQSAPATRTAPASQSATATPTATAQVYNGRAGQLEVSLPKTTAEIVIDGSLSEAAWRQAAMLTGFSQYAPVDQQPAADSTEILLMYTPDALYVGMRAYEPHGQVVGTLADRDKIGSNDNIQLILDTFKDRRRALIFSVNALGVQSDGTFTDGAGTDLSPDFIYQSRGRVTDYGYEVELRIPFKSIRFQQADAQQWGLQVLRNVMHSGHQQTWTPALASAPSFLTQSGTLTDLTGMRQGLVLDINPVMTARMNGSSDGAADPSWRYRREDPEFGGNVRWGVTPNISLNATVNPDFSQVEADVGQVITDPRQTLFFPEKRPFFLEANENFQVPNSLIYTRRIVAPEAAAKVSGKVGGLNIGALSAVDGDDIGPDGSTNPIYNILRLRRDIGPQSNAGLVYTDRIYGDDFNRVLGFDTRLLVASRYVLNAQLAGSFTSTSGRESMGKPLFDFSLTRTGRESGFNLVAEGVHPEFVAGSGFISRPGIARVFFSPRRTWFPQNSIVESITFSPIFDNTWEWDRFTNGTEPNDIKVNSSTNVRLRGGWHATLYHWTESFKYPAYLYTNYFIEQRDAAGAVVDTVPYVGTDRLTNIGGMFALRTPQWKEFSGSVELIGGQDDNFDEWSSAWILYSTVEANWSPTEKLRINGRFLEQRVHRKSDGSLVRLRTIPRLKLEYQVSRPIFVRAVAQYDGSKVDALRDDSRTNAPILIRTATGFRPALAQERGGLRLDWLFSYQPNPGTVVFAGYGASMGSPELFNPRELERTSDGFFIKLSYLFRM